MKIINALLDLVTQRTRRAQITFASAVELLAEKGDDANISPQELADALDVVERTPADLQRVVAMVVELKDKERIAAGREDKQVRRHGTLKAKNAKLKQKEGWLAQWLTEYRDIESDDERAAAEINDSMRAQAAVPHLRARVLEELSPDHARAEAGARASLQSTRDAIVNIEREIVEARREGRGDERIAALEGQLDGWRGVLPARQAALERLAAVPVGGDGAGQLATGKGRRG